LYDQRSIVEYYLFLEHDRVAEFLSVRMLPEIYESHPRVDQIVRDDISENE
jgi:hypothetical protein